MEEERVRGLDVIHGLGLLDRQPVESAVLIIHEAQPAQCPRVVEAFAMEICRVPVAAVFSDSPEVICVQRRIAQRDGRNAVHLEVPEAHRFGHVELGTLGEGDPTRVHDLLPANPGRTDPRIAVQVPHPEVRERVVGPVFATSDETHDPGQEHREEEEKEPVRLPLHIVVLLPGHAPGEASAESNHHESSEHHKVTQEGVLIVHFEGQGAEDHAEDNDGHDEAHNDWGQVHFTAVRTLQEAFLQRCPDRVMMVLGMLAATVAGLAPGRRGEE
mmetsp:Transcript_26220/g.57672  ORF Transcript_26220/g.57672 Transcript_26220/m.57672 type:complete len:272 (-) Transcript_26220:83-898(-)